MRLEEALICVIIVAFAVSLWNVSVLTHNTLVKMDWTVYNVHLHLQDVVSQYLGPEQVVVVSFENVPSVGACYPVVNASIPVLYRSVDGVIFIVPEQNFSKATINVTLVCDGMRYSRIIVLKGW